jgi:hypothetical protein
MHKSQRRRKTQSRFYSPAEIPKGSKIKQRRENLVETNDRYAALASQRRRFDLSLLQWKDAIRRAGMQSLCTYRGCGGEQGSKDV